MYYQHHAGEQSKCITLTDIEESAVDSLVDFKYTAKIDVHEGNVQSIFKAASILQLSEIIGVCCSFLSGLLCITENIGDSVIMDAGKQLVTRGM